MKAVNNGSTFQYYLVIKYKNTDDSEISEICTQGNFLRGAIHQENRIGYSSFMSGYVNLKAMMSLNRRFKFKTEDAKNNIGVGDYSMKELKELENEINFDSLANEIKSSDKWQQSLPNYKEMRMYAHALFNRGILTGESNCWGGTLYYVKNKE